MVGGARKSRGRGGRGASGGSGARGDRSVRSTTRNNQPIQVGRRYYVQQMGGYFFLIYFRWVDFFSIFIICSAIFKINNQIIIFYNFG